MLKVIGVSVTMEYAGKIIYEGTLGKLFGYFSNGIQSEEEKVIIQAQRAYSDFIYDTAWYEFAFLSWINKAWAVSDSSNASQLRKWERTLFFTLEFSMKAAYAQLIEWAARSSYEAAVTDIYVMASGKVAAEEKAVKIIKTQNGHSILSIARWGAFTNTLLALKGKDITISEIGGNDEIAVSVLLAKSDNIHFDKLELLYESRVVTKEDVKRAIYLLPVNHLLPFIQHAKNKSIEIEHIYDY